MEFKNYNDPITTFVVFFLASFAVLGVVTTLCFIGLGIWKFMELIS
jgi:hypothetical protein